MDPVCFSSTMGRKHLENFTRFEQVMCGVSPQEAGRIEREFSEFITYYNHLESLKDKTAQEVVAILKHAGLILDPHHSVEKILRAFFRTYLNEHLCDLVGTGEVYNLVDIYDEESLVWREPASCPPGGEQPFPVMEGNWKKL